jgi:hypothetical protein
MAISLLPVAPPRHPNQIPPEVTRRKQRDFLVTLASTGRHTYSCKLVGIDLSTPFNWASKSEHFAKRFEEARAEGEKVLLAAYETQVDRRAFEGKTDPQSAVLTMFRMKKLDPRYRDNATVQIALVGPPAIALDLNVERPQLPGKPTTRSGREPGE